MTPKQIRSLGPRLADFLDQFDDCFGRSEPRNNLAHYIRAQLSDLPRKSAEPIALAAGLAPRTLQVFLSDSPWDHERLRDRIGQLVARDHADSDSIGIVDETGHPKKGDQTAGVSRQYCGRTGKIDNCVVTVHLGYATGDQRFFALLDSDLYLPAKDWEDPQRREKVHIPEAIRCRPKHEIAVGQIERALGNGVRFGWITADEGYGRQPQFLAALDRLGQDFVVEIPRNQYGWLIPPVTLAGERPKRVDRLARHSRLSNRKPWVRFLVKETSKGPVLWEAKECGFWMRQGKKIAGPYRLVLARNVRDPSEVKYFLARAPKGTPLLALLRVAFSRWPIERTFQDAKTELGLSHFEVRSYGGILRHCYVTQLSYLFLSEATERLRGEKSGDHPLPSPLRRQRGGRQLAAKPGSTRRPVRPSLGAARLLSGS